MNIACIIAKSWIHVVMEVAPCLGIAWASDHIVSSIVVTSSSMNSKAKVAILLGFHTFFVDVV
jgi:hypothetical protein